MLTGEPTSRGADDTFRALLEHLPGVPYSAQAGSPRRWLYLSPGVEELLGRKADELIADPSLWEAGIHPDDLAAVLASPSSSEAPPESVEYRFCRPDGRQVFILDERVPGEHGTVWHGQMRDITQEKATRAVLRGEAARQEGLVGLSEMALAGAGFEDLIAEAVNVAATLDGVREVFLWERPANGEVLMLHAALRMPEGGANWRALSADRTTHAGAVAETSASLLVEDWGSEERFSLPAAALDRGICSSAAVPIEGGEKFFGVLDVHAADARHFREEELHFLEAIARIVVDAKSRGNAAEDLRREALHDSITGLPNRLLFVEEVNRALGRAFASASSVAVLFCDLDRFKLINDSLGHAAGDDLLRAVAPRLRAQLRPGDLVAHFGGDDFGILLADLKDSDEAKNVSGRILDSFDQGFDLNGIKHFVTASVGIALAPAGTARSGDAEAMLRDADAAMYRAKDEGRARYAVYDHRMRSRATKRLAIERELHRAIEEEELIVHYQPVVDLSQRKIHALEALVRWNHPRRGLLPPAEFISVAEDSGLIADVGNFVLERACMQTLAWNTLRPDERPLEIAVNLSPRQLAHPEMTDTVNTVLSETGLPPEHLKLEITESLLVDRSGVADLALNGLKELGVSLVLDDFGTGYSSLAYLDRFPIDGLKVDRSFVAGLGSGAQRGAVVQAIIGMAHALSLSVVAEGVETVEQLTELRRMECNYIQGFLFSEPLPAEAVMPLLTAGIPDPATEASAAQLDVCSVKPLV